MSSEKKIQVVLEGKRVNIENTEDIQNWCKVFDCSKGELTATVAIVGNSAKRVKNYIGKIKL